MFFVAYFTTFAQKSPLESQTMRLDAAVRQDSMLLQKLLSDDLTFIHSNGLLETKTSFIISIKNGKIKYNSFEVLEQHIRNYGRKTAIINGKIIIKGTYEKSPYEVNLLFTSMYRKQFGRWQLVAWQSTKRN